jgi:hypothetical protein
VPHGSHHDRGRLIVRASKTRCPHATPGSGRHVCSIGACPCQFALLPAHLEVSHGFRHQRRPQQPKPRHRQPHVARIASRRRVAWQQRLQPFPHEATPDTSEAPGAGEHAPCRAEVDGVRECSSGVNVWGWGRVQSMGLLWALQGHACALTQAFMQAPRTCACMHARYHHACSPGLPLHARTQMRPPALLPVMLSTLSSRPWARRYFKIPS